MRCFQNLPSFTEYPPPPYFNNYVRPSQPESTPPSQDIPPFQQLYVTLPESIPLPLRINAPSQQIYYYAMLPESTPPSQNTPPPPSQQLCATLPESTPPSQNRPPFSTNCYVRPSQNLPPPLPRIYTLFNNYNIMRPSQYQPLPPRIFFSSWSQW